MNHNNISWENHEKWDQNVILWESSVIDTTYAQRYVWKRPIFGCNNNIAKYRINAVSTMLWLVEAAEYSLLIGSQGWVVWKISIIMGVLYCKPVLYQKVVNDFFDQHLCWPKLVDKIFWPKASFLPSYFLHSFLTKNILDQ